MERNHRFAWLGLALAALLLLILGRDFGQTILAQSNATPTPNINWVNTRGGINIRGGPGYEYERIGALPLGTWVEPVARNKDGQWILINYLSTMGWVQRDGVYWRLSTASLPVLSGEDFTPIPPPSSYSNPAAPPYTPNANWVNVGLDGAYVRSGPGQGWPPIGQIFTGEIVDPLARDEAGNWVLIRYGTGYGWISRSLVVWITDVDSLPVYASSDLTPQWTLVPTIRAVTNTPFVPATQRPTGVIMPTYTLVATTTRTPFTPLAPASATATTFVTVAPTEVEPDTATPTPTIPDTNTPLPPATITPLPTNTPIPPTNTPRPPATEEPPTSTPQPTNTPIPPTNTPRPPVTEAPQDVLTDEPEPLIIRTPRPTSTPIVIRPADPQP